MTAGEICIMANFMTCTARKILVEESYPGRLGRWGMGHVWGKESLYTIWLGKPEEKKFL
jgi:hypothetical protein